MKKALAMTLALVFVSLGAAAAFGAGQAAEPEGPMEITWMGLYAHNVEEGNPIQTLLEEKFNVKFINEFAEYQESEANSLRVAADEHPDAMYTWGYDRLEFFLKGAFRTIPRSMIEEHMPLYTASMNKLGAGSWYYGLAPGTSDEYYALPRREDYAANCGRLYTIRLDYIEAVAPELLPEALNPDIVEDLAPTTAPGHFLRWLDHYTWEQLQTLIHALATGDPDGNGRNDTVAVGIMGELPWDHTWGAGLVFNPHGIYGVDNYPEPDGSTVWIDTSSRSLAALKVLQSWFQAGYIDGELPAVNRQQVEAQLVEGRVAISGRPASVVTQNCGRRLEIGGRAQLCNTAVDENPNARFVTVLPPLGPRRAPRGQPATGGGAARRGPRRDQRPPGQRRHPELRPPPGDRRPRPALQHGRGREPERPLRHRAAAARAGRDHHLPAAQPGDAVELRGRRVHRPP
jgi:ABC-type glycerol-3-phosphate transport system substrate-binding protein